MTNRQVPIEIRQMKPEDFDEIIHITTEVYPESVPWRKDQLESHLKMFPEGQLVAIRTDTGAVLGYGASLIVSWEDYDMDSSWKNFTDKGMFTNHDPVAGRTLYGAEIMVRPSLQGFGIGRKLYDARRDLAKQLKLIRIRAGARLIDYHKFADQMTAEEYVRKVLLGEIRDRTLSFQLKNGFHVLDVVADYLLHDSKSQGFAAIIEWINPEEAEPRHYEPIRRSKFNLKKDSHSS